MGVSKDWGTPKSSILPGFSIVNHPFWGTPIFGNTHILLKSHTSHQPTNHCGGGGGGGGGNLGRAK